MKKLFTRASLVITILILSSEIALAAPALGYFEMTPDAQGNRTTLTPYACTYVCAQVLAAGVAETVTVPTGAAFVFFSGTDNYYVNFTTTATVPAADVTNGSASSLNPGSRKIKGIATFSIISPVTCIVTMEFYKDRS